jgi:deazaflavin-dependent oxidoreductase (nitroreductase family)
MSSHASAPTTPSTPSPANGSRNRPGSGPASHPPSPRASTYRTTLSRDIIYVFATKAGAPTNPDWYYNLTAAGDGSVELGTGTYRVTVRQLAGAERDRIYAEQARRYPGFAEYERQTAGIRTIPVLELELLTNPA